MKLSSSPLIILVVALTASSIAPTVEGRKRRSKAKSEKIEALIEEESTTISSPIAATAPAPASASSSKSSKEAPAAPAKVTAAESSPTASASSPTDTTPSPTKSSKAASARSAKAAKAASSSAKSAKKLRFSECSIANPPYEQAKLVTSNSGLTMMEYLTSQLLNKGVDGYLALHSTNVYMTFVELVEDWVENPSDTTKESIMTAGEAAGTIHANLALTAEVQCTMMDALVNQMKDSCNFKYSGEKDAYVKVASAYMTGFNSEAGDVQTDFVDFCNLGSLWE